MINKHPFARSLPVLAALLLGACASAPREPGDPVAAAEDALLSAEDARATDYAAPEMRSARAKLAQAQALQKHQNPDGKDDGSQRRSRWLAEEAMADAELAEAKATNVRTRAVVAQLQSGETLPPLVEPPPPPPDPNMPREPVLPPRAIPAPVVPGAAALPASQPSAPLPAHDLPAPVVPGAAALPSDPDAVPAPTPSASDLDTPPAPDAAPAPPASGNGG